MTLRDDGGSRGRQLLAPTLDRLLRIGGAFKPPRQQPANPCGDGTWDEFMLLEPGDGSDATQGRGQEQLVGGLEPIKTQGNDLGRDLMVIRQFKNEIPHDPGKTARGEWWGEQDPVPDGEDVGRCSLANLADRIEEKRFIEARGAGLMEGEDVLGIGCAFQAHEGRAFVPDPGTEGERKAGR